MTDRASPADQACLLGRPLTVLTRSEFFAWFSCVECPRRDTADGDSIIEFRPEGPRFESLVALSVILRRQVINGLDLSFEPAMLDDGNLVFALDCTKSFLALIAPQSGNGDSLRDLATNIEALMAEQSISAWNADRSRRNSARRRRAHGGEDARRRLPGRLQVWPRVPYGWQLMAPMLPEARASIAQIGRFVDRVQTQAAEMQSSL